jgi:hypothetical protein
LGIKPSIRSKAVKPVILADPGNEGRMRAALQVNPSLTFLVMDDGI